MASSLYPPNIGFIPISGQGGTIQTPTLTLGRDVSVTWEAVGFGGGGRPDYIKTVIINLTDNTVMTAPTKKAAISIDVADVLTIIASNANATTAALTLKLREVDVCDDGTAKKMMILASATYLP